MIIEYLKDLNVLRMSGDDTPLDSSNACINVAEADTLVKFCKSADWKGNKLIVGKLGDVYTSCIDGSDVLNLFDLLWKPVPKVEEPKVRKLTLDVKATLLAPEDGGTSILFRKRNGIYIARRHKNQKISFDCVTIDNNTREQFFADVKASPLFSGQYYVDVGDENLYRMWDSFIHNRFVTLYVNSQCKSDRNEN